VTASSKYPIETIASDECFAVGLLMIRKLEKKKNLD
jgi:hypothetical protein